MSSNVPYWMCPRCGERIGWLVRYVFGCPCEAARIKRRRSGVIMVAALAVALSWAGTVPSLRLYTASHTLVAAVLEAQPTQCTCLCPCPPDAGFGLKAKKE